jgi:hypothetical protein
MTLQGCSLPNGTGNKVTLQGCGLANGTDSKVNKIFPQWLVKSLRPPVTYFMGFGKLVNFSKA